MSNREHAHQQRIPAAGVIRVSVESAGRDVDARWVEADEIRIRGEAAEVLVEAGSVLVIDDDGGRGPLSLELPTSLPTFSVWLSSGDLNLEDVRGETEVRLEGGSVDVHSGTGSLVATADGVKVAGFEGPIAVSTGSGDVTLLRIDGAISLESGSGDVRLEHGSGATAIKTGSGDVAIRGRRCSGLAIKAGSGDVTVVDGAIQSVAIQTGSGEIRCRSGLGIGTHNFTTGTGDIEVGIPRNLAARIEATTSRGRVESDIPLVEVGNRGPKRQRGQRVVGSVGDLPERADISLRTASGHIRLRWMEPAPQFGLLETSEPTTARPAPSADAAGPMPDHDRRRILEALAAGVVTPEEAGRLLDGLEAAERRQTDNSD